MKPYTPLKCSAWWVTGVLAAVLGCFSGLGADYGCSAPMKPINASHRSRIIIGLEAGSKCKKPLIICHMGHVIALETFFAICTQSTGSRVKGIGTVQYCCERAMATMLYEEPRLAEIGRD